MNRRGDTEPSYEGLRAGIFNRLVDQERVGLMDAETWLRAWEAKADEIGWPRGSYGFWEEGWRWIIEEREAQRAGSD
jgi:hypothetical protein